MRLLQAGAERMEKEVKGWQVSHFQYFIVARLNILVRLLSSPELHEVPLLVLSTC